MPDCENGITAVRPSPATAVTLSKIICPVWSSLAICVPSIDMKHPTYFLLVKLTNENDSSGLHLRGLNFFVIDFFIIIRQKVYS